MSQEQYQKITLEQLIAKKEQMLEAKKQKRRMDCYVESLGGVVTLEEPSRSVVRDAAEMGDDGDKYVVYQCCVEPCLKSQELLAAYNPPEPPDIVFSLFRLGEVNRLAKQCMDLAGYTDESVVPVKDLKN